MPRSRFFKLSVDRQREILEQAAREFAAHGYGRASLNRIIASVGLNKGSFYYCFDGKADLFEAVVQMLWDVAVPPEDSDPTRLDADTFWPALEEAFHRGHMELSQRPWLAGVARLLLVPPGSEPDAPPQTDILERGQRFATRLLAHGQCLGVVRDDVPLDYLLTVLTAADHASDRWLIARIDGATHDEREKASLQTVDLWRRIAQPRGTGTPRRDDAAEQPA